MKRPIRLMLTVGASCCWPEGVAAVDLPHGTALAADRLATATLLDRSVE